MTTCATSGGTRGTWPWWRSPPCPRVAGAALSDHDDALALRGVRSRPDVRARTMDSDGELPRRAGTFRPARTHGGRHRVDPGAGPRLRRRAGPGRRRHRHRRPRRRGGGRDRAGTGRNRRSEPDRAGRRHRARRGRSASWPPRSTGSATSTSWSTTPAPACTGPALEVTDERVALGDGRQRRRAVAGLPDLRPAHDRAR